MGDLWSDHPQFSWAKASDPNMIFLDDMRSLGCNYSLPFEKNISFAWFFSTFSPSIQNNRFQDSTMGYVIYPLYV